MAPGEEQVEWVADIMRTERVDRCNIDYSGGWGTSLLAGLRERLAKFKQPKAAVVLEALPRNAMGKVQKNLLREQHKGLFVG
mgnify:CR=1 FL=1